MKNHWKEHNNVKVKMDLAKIKNQRKSKENMSKKRKISVSVLTGGRGR